MHVIGLLTGGCLLFTRDPVVDTIVPVAF